MHVSPAAPYFVTESGDNWTPIGQNDAITWPDLDGLYQRRDVTAVERYLDMLTAHGVNCLRVMMEYSQKKHSLFETEVGKWNPRLVRFWDDLFAMCGERGLRILLTPYDTFWMKIRWDDHPYNTKNGGFCDDVRSLLLHPETRKAAKARLAYASERWGGSGTLFAWDVWNEIHPSFSEDSGEIFEDFIGDLSRFLREHEIKVHGRAHPQTVSMFSPHITLDHFIPGAIYRHSELDFTSTHLYEEGAIDFPKNTVDSAIRFGALVKHAVEEATPARPYFDSEHGPIHLFLDHHKQLEEPFDDEYFRHMQWAHVSCGGAGGGMRWPYRWPHSLTPGMRKEQLSLSRFVEHIDWKRFDRKVLSIEVPNFAAFACAGSDQAVAYLIRKDTIGEDGMLRKDAVPVETQLSIPGLQQGCYEITCWNTAGGEEVARVRACVKAGSTLQFATPPIATDMSFACRRLTTPLPESVPIR